LAWVKTVTDVQQKEAPIKVISEPYAVKCGNDMVSCVVTAEKKFKVRQFKWFIIKKII